MVSCYTNVLINRLPPHATAFTTMQLLSVSIRSAAQLKAWMDDLQALITNPHNYKNIIYDHTRVLYGI